MEAVAPTPGNFLDHVSAHDGAPAADGGDDNAVPDKPVQIQDQPEVDPASPVLDDVVGDDAPDAEVAEPEQPDETEALRALKAELDAGDALPESLRDRTVPVKINGSTYEVPVSELALGYQRNADYSRKLAEVQQMREQATQMQRGAQNLLADLKNPQTFLQAARELEFYDAFIHAAREEGKRRLQMRELPPEAQQYAAQLEQERYAREQAARRAQQLEQRLNEFQKQQPNPDQVRVKNQLDQLVPRAFAKHKLGDYPLAREMFGQNLNNLYEGGEVTAALVDSAAQATAEQLADIAARLPKQSANDNARNGMLTARRTAGAPGKPVARNKGGTSTDFAAHLDRLNGSR